MSRLILAFRAFFLVLCGRIEANRLQALPQPEPTAKAASESPKVEAQVGQRSDAVNLLAALQRDARFVDLVQESLDDYSDEQVGAATRDVLRNCRSTLERIFAMQPVMKEAEHAEVQVSDQPDSGRIRLTGNVSGQPPYRGQLVHHGWQATKCDLPTWSGSVEAVKVVAPAEIELP